jgi:hypothetical protein
LTTVKSYSWIAKRFTPNFPINIQPNEKPGKTIKSSLPKDIAEAMKYLRENAARPNMHPGFAMRSAERFDPSAKTVAALKREVSLLHAAAGARASRRRGALDHTDALRDSVGLTDASSVFSAGSTLRRQRGLTRNHG